MKACFMGLGYIGLPTAIIAAEHGIEVIGVDINPQVVDMTNQGLIHIVEPGLQELCRKVVTSVHLKASEKPETSDVYLVVVPTPFKGNHEPDISYVETATRSVIPLLKENDLFIIESTSPVGTTDKMTDLIFSLRPELKGKIYIAYCPDVYYREMSFMNWSITIVSSVGSTLSRQRKRSGFTAGSSKEPCTRQMLKRRRCAN